MFVRLAVLLAGVFVFAGCATVAPMKPEAASQFKTGKVAVSFFDPFEQINYIEDKYFVLGVAQVASNSTYSGLWNSNLDLSKLHTEELNKLGVPATSIYDIFTDSEMTQVNAELKQMYPVPQKGQKAKKSTPPVVTPQLSEMLRAKGYDRLIAVSWGGYTLHMQTLGLPTVSQLNASYRFVDLQTAKPLWTGIVLIWEDVEVPSGKSGKDFLETDNLAGLKAEVDRDFRERYKIRKRVGVAGQSIGQIVGFQQVKSGR